jgi:hypothetical protein
MWRKSCRICLSLSLASAMGLLLGCPLVPGKDNGTGESKFVLFVDPDSDFSTRDVRDVEEEIVRFDSETNSIVWTQDGTSYQAGAWTTNGNLLGANGSFQVRFGTKDGQRRAYFTETGPATLCDIRVTNGNLQIFPTAVTVPQE